jgi:AraC-like DNA-binding protein
MASMMPTGRQARERMRRGVRSADGRQPRRGRDAERTAPTATGTSLDDIITLAAPGALALRRMANLLARYAPHDGVFPLRLPGTYALRRARMTSEPVHATLGPSLCIVAQGAKVVMLGSEVLEYDPARMLVFAVDLPISGQVTRASSREPFLGFKLDLDPARVAELAARVYPRGVPKASDNRGLYVGHATDDIIDGVTRLLDLMARPEDADLLGPLVVDEILIRLLRTPIGTRVAQIGEPKSGVHRVAEAVSWIRAHFAQPVTVEEMAASINMSASSFHQRFKAVTTMSPLQYQKVLRLHEARRLMLFQKMDASDACHRVGYLSPSQFSREYARFFGSAPTKDIARLRGEGFASGEAERQGSIAQKREAVSAADNRAALSKTLPP